MANDNKKTNYLLVTLKEFDEELVQEILETALAFKLPPISYNNAYDKFIFEERDDLADQFCQALIEKDIPVTTEKIFYTF